LQLLACEDGVEADHREAEEAGAPLAVSRHDAWTAFATRKVTDIQRRTWKELDRIATLEKSALTRSEAPSLILHSFAEAEAKAKVDAELTRRRKAAEEAAAKAHLQAMNDAIARQALHMQQMQSAAAQQAAKETKAEGGEAPTGPTAKAEAGKDTAPPAPSAPAPASGGTSASAPAAAPAAAAPAAAAAPPAAPAPAPAPQKELDAKSKLLASMKTWKGRQ